MNDVLKPFALGRMKFGLNLNFKIDEFKDVMKYFRHSLLLVYPFAFTQPAYADDETLSILGDSI